MREIPLTQGKVAIVDDGDYDCVVALGKWRVRHSLGSDSWYAHRYIPGSKKKEITMHGFILGEAHGRRPDHIDGDGLNNRRANLRFATPAENCQNRRRRIDCLTGYKGVSYHANCKRHWEPKIWVDGRHIYLGLFDSPEEAAVEYDVAAKEHFGEFAHLNFPFLATHFRRTTSC